MAGEIEIPVNLWAHRISNPNARWKPVALGAGWNPQAWGLPTAVAVDINGEGASRVPSHVHATPAGKLRIRWLTESADMSSVVRFHVFAKYLVPNTSAADKAWDDTLTVDDVSNGAKVVNEVEVALVNTVLAAGRLVAVVIRRNKPGTSEDTLAAQVELLKVEIVANAA